MNMEGSTSCGNLAGTLRRHIEICREMLGLVERESHSLIDPEPPSQFGSFQARKVLLPMLEESVRQLRTQRLEWQRLDPEQRANHSEAQALFQDARDLVMKILTLDRENEQALLRRGLIPPRHLPPANRQRPHFVAELYRRSA
jgi:hypothetical protein